MIPDKIHHPGSVLLGGREWRLRSATLHAPWYKLWYLSNPQKYFIAMDNQGWYWLATRASLHMDSDIGPFGSFEAAAACFETLV